MLRVALVGCGQIADAHLKEAGRTGLAKVVAVCDRDPDQARQAAARFGVREQFADFPLMLSATAPDVVHIATPPATHCSLALAALEVGAHVYVEKPFAVETAETDLILAAARRHRRLVCAGHDLLFDPAWVECRSRISSGAIGEIAHIDILQAYALDGPFGAVVAADRRHWVHALPGGLFQNTLPHAFAAIAALLPHHSAPDVMAVSWDPHKMGFDTDLHVVARSGRASAVVSFATAPRPASMTLRVHGTRGSLEVDYEARVVRARRAVALPSVVTKLHAPLMQLREALAASARNGVRLARADLHYFAGMQALLRAFYTAILERGTSPTPDDHIRRVALLIDAVVAACGRARQTL